MVITHASVAALRSGFSTVFESAKGSTQLFHEQLATTIPSSHKIETYAFMDRLPKMRKQVGPRVVQNLRELAVQVVNDPYELTIGVNADDVADDNLGMYSVLFAEMGRAAAKLPDQLLKTALQAGTTNLGFDSVAHFATTHPIDGQSNQSNNYTSTALSTTNFATTRAAMMSLVGADGEPLGVMPDLLVVPPQLEATARTILNAEFIADTNGGGTTNVWRNSARLLVIPELSNQATTWYLLDTSGALKPFFFQLRQAAKLVQKTGDSEDNVFFDNEMLFGTRARGAVGYSPWWLSARCIA